MITSVSTRPPSNSVNQSLSVYGQDQYNMTSNDDSLCMEYLNETTPGHQLLPKYLHWIIIFRFLSFLLNYFCYCRDGASRLPTDQPPPLVRSSSAATKPGVSPYLQKLPHSNFLQIKAQKSSLSTQQQQRRRRRRSTSTGRIRGDLLDSAYQPTNVDHLDLSSFFGNSNHSFRRPTSAPTRTYVEVKILYLKSISYIYFLA